MSLAGRRPLVPPLAPLSPSAAEQVSEPSVDALTYLGLIKRQQGSRAASKGSSSRNSPLGFDAASIRDESTLPASARNSRQFGRTGAASPARRSDLGTAGRQLVALAPKLSSRDAGRDRSEASSSAWSPPSPSPPGSGRDTESERDRVTCNVRQFMSTIDRRRALQESEETKASARTEGEASDAGVLPHSARPSLRARLRRKRSPEGEVALHSWPTSSSSQEGLAPQLPSAHCDDYWTSPSSASASSTAPGSPYKSRPVPSAHSAGRRRSKYRTSGSDATTAELAKESALQECVPEKPLKRMGLLGEGEKIFDRYQWAHHAVLQEDGDGGKVVVCQQKGGSKGFVMKLKAKQTLGDAESQHRYRRNMEWMMNLKKHPGIAAVEEALEDDGFFYTVMELASGGSLLEGLLRNFPSGVIPEGELRTVMRDLLEAVGFLHSNGILHRDIKPDNLLLQSGLESESGENSYGHVMLCDYDHAGPVPEAQDEDGSMAIYGTRRFQAPETFLGRTSRQSDLYSVGVVLYLLVTGQMPFSDDTYDCSRESYEAMGPAGIRCWGAEVHRSMLRAKVDWDGEPWQTQRTCRYLCQWLMAPDYKDRPANAEEALAHDWFFACF
eukprot:gb/GFBE01032282.1/.p1 GENE.gb/GFBE01032282.1/~~gb/GFBE01032282.1/.p1  ORF type:complete len:612 (+),score=112.17 gb/GFBE01032282.1/:1-1836(+)